MPCSAWTMITFPPGSNLARTRLLGWKHHVADREPVLRVVTTLDLSQAPVGGWVPDAVDIVGRGQRVGELGGDLLGRPRRERVQHVLSCRRHRLAQLRWVGADDADQEGGAPAGR